MDIENAVIIDAMSFQTFMTLFILQNTKEDILKNVSVYFPLKKSKGFHFVFTPLAIIIWTQMLKYSS